MYPFLNNLFEGITLLITITFDIYSRNMDIFLLVPRTLHVVAILIKDIVTYAQVTFFHKSHYNDYYFFSRNANLRLFVRLFVDSLSRALNLPLKAVWVSPRSVLGQSQVSLRSVSGQSQSVSGLS